MAAPHLLLHVHTPLKSILPRISLDAIAATGHLGGFSTMSELQQETRGGRRGGRRGEREGGDKSISKNLCYILRHGAEKEGLKLKGDGYANVAELLEMPRFKKLGLTLPKLKQIVRDNDKQRYTLVPASSAPGSGTPAAIPAADGGIVVGIAKLSVKLPEETRVATITVKDIPTAEESDDPSTYLIRANQGHSIAISSESLQLTPLSPEALPVAVHGTFYGSYEAILASGYLSRMTRNHIHLAAAETGVISGMRADAEVLVFVDVSRAVKEGGLAFWTSANGVVLTEGDKEGRLGLEWVQKIVDRKGNLGVLWEGGKVAREFPEGLRGRQAPRGKRGRRGRGRGRGREQGAEDSRAEDIIDAGDP